MPGRIRQVEIITSCMPLRWIMQAMNNPFSPAIASDGYASAFADSAYVMQDEDGSTSPAMLLLRSGCSGLAARVRSPG